MQTSSKGLFVLLVGVGLLTAGCATGPLKETKKLDRALTAHDTLVVDVRSSPALKPHADSLREMVMKAVSQRGVFGQVQPATGETKELTLELTLVELKDENPHARSLGVDSPLVATVEGKLVLGQTLGAFTVQTSSKPKSRVTVGGYEVKKGTKAGRALAAATEAMVDYLARHKR